MEKKNKDRVKIIYFHVYFKLKKSSIQDYHKTMKNKNAERKTK